MKTFTAYLEEDSPDQLKLRLNQQRRVSQIDKSVLEIEAALLGIQEDGTTNSSELIAAMRVFSEKWKREKQAVLQRVIPAV